MLFASAAGFPLKGMHLPPRTRRFTHFTRNERYVIRHMLGRKSTHAEIARWLGKHRSAVSREIRRNTNKSGIYFELHAENMMLARRKAAKSPALIIENDLALEEWVERLFRFGLSPEQIAGYMQRSGHRRALCFKTLYAWAHRKWQIRKRYLRFKGRPRVEYGAKKRLWQPHRKHIRDRPPVVEKRRRVGDWEADLVYGARDGSRHCLLTLNDRATGFVVVKKLATTHPVTVSQMMILALKGLPVHTITCDNGFEFARHRTIERELKCAVYFTDTHSPQQRGSNENFNGLLREYFPKGTSLSHVTQVDVTRVATILNRRPRKRLGYDCPRHVFSELAAKSRYFVR